MTCKEKLILDHPNWDEGRIEAVIDDYCPAAYGYLEDPDNCAPSHKGCVDCWDREIPDSSDKVKHAAERMAARLKDAANKPKEITSILDSGDRTQFESGAVRDMREGKGRFDVAPLEVMANMLCTKEVDHDAVLLDIATFMYEHDTGWLDAALSNFADMAYGGCIPTMFLEVAKHYEEGAKKYSPDNWRKGIPLWCYIDSAVRHYLKWRRGDKDENHDRAFCWNLMCCMWEVEYGEEWRKEKGYFNKEETE